MHERGKAGAHECANARTRERGNAKTHDWENAGTRECKAETRGRGERGTARGRLSRLRVVPLSRYRIVAFETYVPLRAQPGGGAPDTPHGRIVEMQPIRHVRRGRPFATMGHDTWLTVYWG